MTDRTIDSATAPPSGRLKPAVGHTARCLLGLVFLVAGLLKALDPAEFSHQMAGYGIIGPELTAVVAPLLIALETTLGIALLAGFKLRSSLLAAAGLLVFFIGLEGYGMSIGRTEACGCFGAYLQRTPGQVIVEDLVFMVLALSAWLLLGSWRVRRSVAAASVGAAAVLSLVFAIASPHLPIDALVTRLAEGQTIDDLGIGTAFPDLAQGRHLVALIDLTDPGAPETAARLNEVAETPGADPIVALTPSTEDERAAFIWSAVPAFEIQTVDRPLLKRLYRRLPRFFLVDSGRVVSIYDDPGRAGSDLLKSSGS